MPITPQELIANLGDLPPLPQVAAQVLRLATDPDSTTDELQRVIATDQALTAQILKIANSAMFGMVREVRTLTQAIMTLGFSTIKSVVIASSAKNLYSRGGTGLQERLLWEHALVAALSARAYARGFRSPRMEEAFLGGLMHDIGKSVFRMSGLGIDESALFNFSIPSCDNRAISRHELQKSQWILLQPLVEKNFDVIKHQYPLLFIHDLIQHFR